MKAVVNDRFALGSAVINGELMMQVAAFGTKAHVVDDRRRSTTGCSTRAGEKIIAATRNTDVDIEMSMHIDTAGKYITTTGINDLDVAADFEPRTKRADLPLIDQEIALARTIAFDNGAVFDESFHILFRPFKS